MSAFVEVAVGLPVPGTFHYAVPPPLAATARVGARVLVPFGRRGVTGVIVGHAECAPAGVTGVRPLGEVLDQVPSFDAELVDLCLWVADYYQAPPGEVLRAALPAGTAVATRRTLTLTDAGRAVLSGDARGAVPARARRLLAKLAEGDRKAARDAEGVGALEGQGLVVWADQRQAARVQGKTIATVRLLGPYVKVPGTRPAPKRDAVVGALKEAGGEMDVAELARTVPGATGVLAALAKGGWIERGLRDAVRTPASGEGSPRAQSQPLLPTEAQALALAEIRTAMAKGGFRPFLLFGVTGSGKTEVYLQTIASALERGRGAIVLVPEIALTPQLLERFRARFGDRVAMLHSGLSGGERYDQWRRLRVGEAQIALGARSAVFAPVLRLGVVVIDEEHDSSFKQEEGVRYHARDVALVRAQRAGAICVLGSATPSLESYARAQGGKVRLLELPTRPETETAKRLLPQVQIVDLRCYRPDAETLLTAPLADAVEETLGRGEQAILFLNRRGFATFIVCAACGHSFRCPQCSVSLTYHRQGERLRCHYCGHAEHVPVTCPKCQSASSILRLGLGTERIEQALRARYPRARVDRLDRDTAQGRGLREVLARFARRDVDILVGTQMVTKGHDFPGVTLVGVLCADTGLSLPDFRASERTFQLLTQVAGRAGRGSQAGRVVIQTYAPDHAAITCAKNHDFPGFFAAEAGAREELSYPPYGRLIAVRLDGPKEHEVQALAEELGRLAQRLTRVAGGEKVVVLGPAEAPLKRLKGRSRWHLWLRSVDRHVLRAFVHKLVDGVRNAESSVRISVDVDPISAL